MSKKFPGTRFCRMNRAGFDKIFVSSVLLPNFRIRNDLTSKSPAFQRSHIGPNPILPATSQCPKSLLECFDDIFPLPAIRALPCLHPPLFPSSPDATAKRSTFSLCSPSFSGSGRKYWSIRSLMLFQHNRPQAQGVHNVRTRRTFASME